MHERHFGEGSLIEQVPGVGAELREEPSSERETKRPDLFFVDDVQVAWEAALARSGREGERVKKELEESKAALERAAQLANLERTKITVKRSALALGKGALKGTLRIVRGLTLLTAVTALSPEVLRMAAKVDPDAAEVKRELEETLEEFSGRLGEIQQASPPDLRTTIKFGNTDQLDLEIPFTLRDTVNLLKETADVAHSLIKKGTWRTAWDGIK